MCWYAGDQAQRMRACRSSSWRVGPLRARSASGRHSTAVLKFSMPIAFAMPL